MTATTVPSVTVTSDDWTQLSTADVQSLQAVRGSMGLIFSSVKPSSAIAAKAMGHVLTRGQSFSNNTGGTSWGRATKMSGSALVAITEGWRVG